MTDTTKPKRRSHCISCGKRLSAVTATGDIRWQPSHVDDRGLYCETCYAEKIDGKKRKPQEQK